MPANKQAAFRYRVLDACFRRQRGWTVAEMLEHLSEALDDAFGIKTGVSRRTLLPTLIS
ncbi:MAG: hypothetical protein IPL65_22285 [Lewinellaceae bacterium]|nr:hypothetical protein [Lewinellaceae bacterium]